MTGVIDLPAFPHSRVIEEIRSLSPSTEPSIEVARLPNGRTNLVFRELDEGRTAELWVAGPNMHAKFKRKTGMARTVIFQLRPASAVALLGVAASELTDRVVPLEEVWGAPARNLCDELLATESHAEAIDHIMSTVAERAKHQLGSASARLARRAVRLFEGGEARIDQVAQQLGVTSRHLRRTFAQNVGISPKDFARTVRLQRTLQLAMTSSDWARIAQSAGYYDQAHFIGDFHRLVGFTPAAFFDRARKYEASGTVLSGLVSLEQVSPRERR